MEGPRLPHLSHRDPAVGGSLVLDNVLVLAHCLCVVEAAVPGVAKDGGDSAEFHDLVRELLLAGEEEWVGREAELGVGEVGEAEPVAITEEDT